MRSSGGRGGPQGRPLRPGPGGIGPTGPSVTGGDAVHTDMGWLQALGQSVWPDWDSPPALNPDHPSGPLPRVGYAPPGPPSGGQRWAAHLANGGPQPVPADPRTVPADPRAVPADPRAVPGGRRRIEDYDYQATQWERTEEPEIPLWLAKRALAEAGDQAAAIRAAAERDATAIRQQAAALRQQAADEAAAILAAAQRDAEQMRTAVRTMSTELSDIAAFVTQNLITPVMPGGPVTPGGQLPPAVRPAPRPARQPRPGQPGR
jgi:hypothetical protein